MKRKASLLALVLVLALGCGREPSAEPSTTLPPSPTATVIPTEITPTNTPTILPEPTICPEPTETAAPVSLGECSEDELWYIENVLKQKYDAIVTITMNYSGDLVTFYFGKLGDEWVMIKYCYG